MKIKSKLLLSYVLLAFFSVLLLSTIVIVIQNSSIYRQVSRITTLEEDIVNESIEDVIEEHVKLIDNMCFWIENNDVPDDLDINIQNQIQSYMKILVGNVKSITMFYYCGFKDVPDGGFVYNNLDWVPPSDFRHTTRDWYKNALKSDSFVLTDPYVDLQSGDTVVTFSKQIKKGGKTIGVVAADVSINEILDISAAFKITDDGLTFIIDKDGKYVTHTDSSKIANANFFEEYGFSEYKNDIASSKSISQYHDNNKMYFLTRALPSETQWTIVSFGKTRLLFDTLFTTIKYVIIVEIVIVTLAVIISLFITNSIVKPVNVLNKSMSKISSGHADLTQRLPCKGNNEISKVENGFNTFLNKLQTIVKEIQSANVDLNQSGENLKQSTHETTSAITQINSNIQSVHSQVKNQKSSVEETSVAINQIASNINSLGKMISNQSTQVTDASKSIEEMISSIASVANNVSKMSNNFNQLLQDASTGSQKQSDVNEKIKAIVQQSEMLQEANLVISNIAEQTNLLAMNAAIEAAHAGESGKGFSVVADEIRKLSETSTAQSKTIGQQLDAIKESIEQVVLANSQSSIVFESMITKVQETGVLVSSISTALEEQRNEGNQVVETLHFMTDSTLEVKNASEEMSTGTTSILEEVKNLQEATFIITDSINEMGVGAKQINQTGVELSTITKTMNDVIVKIGNQINQFTV